MKNPNGPIVSSKEHYFLQGGGEMGALIRAKDWSNTPLGDPETWPQSLRIAVRIMLDTPFGMYIAWDNEYIQLYNDGYRPILGTTKHPQALGISTRKTFVEIWHTIGPMFEGVMQGIPVGFPDFTLLLDRNGFLEECFFDFSYSPIRLEDGKVGGVLVTVIETTEKVKAAIALKEREQELQFAIEATELGTWDLNPATNKFKGNSRLKEWFGLKPDEEIELPLALAVITLNDRDMVTAAIQTALQFSSGGHYDIIYTIIHPQTKVERIVRAIGRASFNDEGIAYRFNGTLQDVTKETVARRLLTESEQRLADERMVLYNSFMNAPAGISILKGHTYIYEFANAKYEKLVGRKIILGKTVQEHFPELEQQGMIALIDNVFTTGEPFISNELPVELNTKGDGHLEKFYLNLVLHPLKNEKGKTERILAHIIDVSQEVNVRKKIEESEKEQKKLARQLNLATDSAKVGIWSLDMVSSKLEWSGMHKKLWGYDEHSEDLTYEDWHKAIVPEDKELAFQKIEEAKVNHTAYDVEYRISRADDETVHYIRSVGRYYYDDKGEAETLTGISIDITEQKEAEEKIKVSEAKFKMLSETVPHLVWTATPDGKKDYFNQYFLDYTGLSFEELKGDGWQAIIFTDDLKKELQQWNHTLNTGEDFRIEKRIRKHDGTYRWHVSHSIAQKDKQGNITGWIGSSTEIEEQKKFAEELEEKVKERTYQLHIQNETFKQAEESSMQGSYSFNLTTGKLSYSDNLYRLIGYEPNEFEPSLEEFNNHVHPDDRHYVSQAAEKVIASKAAEEWYYRMITKIRTIINIKGTGRVIDSGDENLLVGTLQNITKDVLAAEELREKNIQLERTNAELSSFSYVASHDLQEPLRKIQTFSKRIIEVENFSDTTRDYFERIIAAGERMQNLIISLLDFSRTSATELVFEPCDLTAIVEKSKDDLHLSIMEKKAVVEYENLPTINASDIQLSQLFTNLIDNAIKYSRPGMKPRVKIIASIVEGKEINHPSANQNDYHAIKIEDNGIGFENEYATKIFEIFQRLHGKNEYSGTGIGLAIVKKIVTNHNGFIVAEGIPGIGATFTIYIPAT